MSIGIAQIKQIIGLRANTSNSIAYQDENTVVYPAGANIVLYNIDLKTQKFIPCSEKSTALTTVCISPNRRYIALAEKIADKPVVNIFDLHTLRKRKVLSSTEIQSSEIVSMAFSNDSKNLITQGAGPDWTLLYWTWEKSKIMASTRVTSVAQPSSTVTQVSFNPQDNTQLCVIGNGIYKMFRYADGTLKNYSTLKQEAHNFTSHAWISEERVIAGNDKAEIFLIQNGEVLLEHKLYDIKSLER
jgi:WD40 repeat protein